MGGYFILLAIGAVYALVVLVLALLEHRVRWTSLRLRLARTVPVASARPGRAVRVSGIALVDVPLIAPFTGRRCVWYEVVLEERVRGRFGGSWRPIKTRAACVAFCLRDASGLAVVDPSDAEIASAATRTGRLDADADAAPTARALLAQLRVDATGRTLRWREAALCMDTQLSVRGEPRRSPEAGGATVAGLPPIWAIFAARHPGDLVIGDGVDART